MSDSTVSNAMGLLGYPVRDIVTGFSGISGSVCFDLYGCVQAFVTPRVNEKNEQAEGRWFDVARLQKTGERVMSPPERFAGDHGPNEKAPPRA